MHVLKHYEATKFIIFVPYNIGRFRERNPCSVLKQFKLQHLISIWFDSKNLDNFQKVNDIWTFNAPVD